MDKIAVGDYLYKANSDSLLLVKNVNTSYVQLHIGIFLTFIGNKKLEEVPSEL